MRNTTQIQEFTKWTVEVAEYTSQGIGNILYREDHFGSYPTANDLDAVNKRFNKAVEKPTMELRFIITGVKE